MRQSTHPTPSNGPIETHFAHPTASDGLIETHLARSTPSNGRNESHLAHSTASNGRNESHFTRSTPSNGRNERHGLALHAVTPWARGPAWGSGRCQGGLCPRVGGLTAQPTLDGGGSRSLGDGGGAHSANAATSTEELPLVADAELVEHGCGGTYHRYGSGVIVDLEKELDDGRLSTGRSEDDR